jgi:hypothetical protein
MKGKRGPSHYGGPPKKSHHAKGKKPPAPSSMEAERPVKLSKPQIDERARELARKQVELNGLEKRKRSITREINDDIKGVREVIEVLAKQVVDGEELVKQGDLFANGTTDPGSPDALPPAKATKTLADVGARVERGDGPEPRPAA